MTIVAWHNDPTLKAEALADAAAFVAEDLNGHWSWAAQQLLDHLAKAQPPS